jgi:hypothetical protein
MINFQKTTKQFAELFLKRPRRGMAIYLAAVTLMIIMAVALGTSLILVYQMKSINEAGASVAAFAAAETGIEQALATFTESDYTSGTNVGPIYLGEASYTVSAFLCGAANEFFCARSIGSYHGTQRAIRVRQ